MNSNMKVHIVTIYNSQNCGSFLQAFALREFLIKSGIDVSFQRNKIPYRNRFIYRFALMVNYLLKFKFNKAINIMRTYFGFVNYRHRYFSITNKKNADAYIFGSDTIWNIDENYFNNQWQYYFGKNVEGKKIVYGASVGPTDPAHLINNDELSKCLRDFTSVGIRDYKTQKIFELIGNKETVPVLDPTMLLDVHDYNKLIPIHVESRFLLFYFFGSIPEDIYSEFARFAKDKHLELICFGEYIPNCTKRLIFNPGLMLAYFQKAEYIVTNTFHGNVFSILFNKQFINVDAGKEKINDLLEKFDLSNRTVYDSSSIFPILERNIDFDKVNELVELKKTESQDYLLKALHK